MLSKSVGYAIRALAYLAEKDKPILVREISTATNIPYAFLAKIINTLGRKQIVITQRGIGGGISLAQKPESVSLSELCMALDDPLFRKECVLGMSECPNETGGCPIHEFWSKQRDKEIEFLRKTTLASIVLAKKKPKQGAKEKNKSKP